MVVEGQPEGAVALGPAARPRGDPSRRTSQGRLVHGLRDAARRRFRRPDRAPETPSLNPLGLKGVGESGTPLVAAVIARRSRMQGVSHGAVAPDAADAAARPS
jgi:hypothetical protein